MQTYFIRHTADLDVDDDTRTRLWEERRIAIHYPHDKHVKLAESDNASTDPTDYQGVARTYVERLLELATEGGYVCAQHYPKSQWMLGLVPPGSSIELLQGTWGDANDLGGRPAILKTLPLQNVTIVSPLDYAVLQAGRPRQGTINRWPSAKCAVQNLVEGIQNQPALQNLSPAQQEIMCSEFLRLAATQTLGLPRLAHLALPPGRTMRDLDILATADDGKKLLAQVTFAPLATSAWKLDRLKAYGDQNVHLILFCDCPQKESIEGVTIFPIAEVFKLFNATPSGRASLLLWA